MRVAGVMLVLIALGAAGCAKSGSSSTPAASSSPPPQSTTPQAPAPQGGVPGSPGLQGELSYEEYRAILHEYERFDQLRSALGRSHPSGQALRAVRSVCAAVAKPGTRLTRLVANDCRNAVTYRDTTGVLANAVQRCSGAVECTARAYTAFATGTRVVAATARAINTELAQRGIGGRCATSIGISHAALGQLSTEIQAADAAAAALRAGDQFDYKGAVQLLQQALGNPPNDPNPTQGIRTACAHAPASKRATPRRKPPKPSKPAKPRIPQPDDLIKT